MESGDFGKKQDIDQQSDRNQNLPDSEKASNGFFSIPLTNLCVDTVTDFELYMVESSSHSPILYRGAHTTLTENHLDTLRENKVKSLWVKLADQAAFLRYMEKNLPSILCNVESVDQKAHIVYDSANQLMKDVLEKPDIGENIQRVKSMIDSTINHIVEEPESLANMINIMSFDYYTYTHSVNVCVFGLALGRRLKLNHQELQILGSGLMMHDIGKSEIPPEVLNKQGPLTSDEWKIMKQHPELGLKMIESSTEVHSISKKIVVQHHEKISGEGYPGGLSEADIHPFALIASIADVFDALTTKRVYKKAIDTFPAVEILMKKMSGSFNKDYLREFILMLNLADSLATSDQQQDAKAA